MTKRAITPAEAAGIIGKRGGQAKSERKRKAATANAQSAGRTPKGYVIRKINGRWYAVAEQAGWQIVGDENGYAERRDAMQAARDDKARRKARRKAGEE